MRVFLVDAHPVFREGLKTILKTCPDLRIVGEAEKCPDALTVNPDECDVFVLDGDTVTTLDIGTHDIYKA